MKITIEFAEKEKEQIRRYLKLNGIDNAEFLCSDESAHQLMKESPDQITVKAINHGYDISIRDILGVKLYCTY